MQVLSLAFCPRGARRINSSHTELLALEMAWAGRRIPGFSRGVVKRLEDWMLVGSRAEVYALS